MTAIGEALHSRYLVSATIARFDNSFSIRVDLSDDAEDLLLWAEKHQTAEARAPHHPRFGLWAAYRATGHLFMLNYSDGLTGANQAIERTPNYYQPHLSCAWTHTGLGDR